MGTAAAAMLIAAYAAWFIWPWTGAGFMPDDLMNCHRALAQPWWKLLADHVTIFQPSPEYRPLGSLFYRAIYSLAGFDPQPFHAALYAILALNSVLTYAAVRRFTGSPPAAWIATVLHAWHGNWAGLHMNTGFCFDVLCYTFFTAALIAFFSNRPWLFLALFLLSLNAKEMAVSMPVACFAWCLAHKDVERRQVSAAVAAVLLTVLFIAGRVLAPGGLASISEYRPHYSFTVWLSRSSEYLQAAAYHSPSAAHVLGLALAAATVWTLWRHREAGLVGCAILFAGMLPVSFIGQRGFDAAYVPALGAVVLLALPMAGLLSRLSLDGSIPATLAAILFAGSFHQMNRHQRSPSAERAEANHIMEVSRQLRSRVPCLNPGSRVLFLADPFPQFNWNSLFLVRLVYGDMSLEVDRPDRVRSRDPQPYSATLTWQGEAGFQ